MRWRAQQRPGKMDAEAVISLDSALLGEAGQWDCGWAKLDVCACCLSGAGCGTVAPRPELAGCILVRPPEPMTDSAKYLHNLFFNNREWSRRIREAQPDFFEKLTHQQAPDYLWIGCSDSRVPANDIVGLLPGELFVHRNVANMVVHTDLNCLTVMQFAVDVLKVEHIMVVGHYGCSGVRAALFGDRLGLADNWLHHIHDVRDKHHQALADLEDPDARTNRLCELNVIEQVVNVCQTTIVRDAWSRGQPVAVHGWIYGLHDGLLRDLNVTASTLEEAHLARQTAQPVTR